MSKPKTVHTIESLLARCEEEGDCFLWTGYIRNDTPQVHNGEKMVSVRKLLCQLADTNIERAKYFASKCENPR